MLTWGGGSSPTQHITREAFGAGRGKSRLSSLGSGPSRTWHPDSPQQIVGLETNPPRGGLGLATRGLRSFRGGAAGGVCSLGD